MIRRALWLLLTLLAALARGQAAPSVVPAHKRALVIGVGTTPGLAALAYAAADAKSFAERIESDLRFTPDEVHLLTTEAGEAPTRVNVLAALDKSLADPALLKGELFVLYFSGHGIGRKGGDYLVTSDAHEERIETEGVRVNDLLARITARGLKNVLIVADACRSGGESTFGAELVEQARKANVALLLGCAPGSRSYEYPRLGHGVFTHFLLRGLADAKSLDANGILWTSAMAARIGKQVQDYTAVDYGDDAQKPGGFADGARDVVLRITPTNLTPEALDAYAASAKTLSPETYAASVLDYVRALVAQRRYEDAIRLMKAAQGVGEQSEEFRILLASVLIGAGREGEAAPILAELAASKNAYYSAWAVTLDESPTNPPATRIAAAKRMWALTHGADDAMAVYAILSQYGTARDLRDFVDEVARTLPPDDHTSLVFQGSAYVQSGEWARAADVLERTFPRPASAAADETAALLLYTALTQSDEAARFERGMATLGEKHPESGTFLALTAFSQKNRGARAEALASAKAALARPEIAADVVSLLYASAGYQVGELADGFGALAKTYPYDWRIRLYALLAEMFGNGKGISPERIAREVTVYANDEASRLEITCTAIEGPFRDGAAAGTISPREVHGILSTLATSLKGKLDVFGRRGTLWSLLVSYALQTGDTRNAELAFAARVGASRPTDDAALRRVRLTLAIAEGDGPAMARTWKEGGFAESDRADLGLTYAMTLFARNEIPAAEAVWTTLKTISPARAAEARALNLALTGARAALLTYKPEGSVDAAIAGLALGRLGDRSRDADLLGPSVDDVAWQAIPVSAAAIAMLADHARERGDAVELARLAYAASMSYTGNPAFDPIAAPVKPALAAYVARYAGPATFIDMSDSGATRFTGKIEAEAKADGTFTLTFTSDDGPALSAKGRFDANGNMVADAVGAEWQMRAKLVPPALMAKVPGGAAGQLFSMSAPAGWWALIVVPLPASPAVASGRPR